MQSYTHTSTSSDDSKLLPKKFSFVIFCVFQVYRKESSKYYVVVLLCTSILCIQRSYVTRFISKNARYITYFSKNKRYCGQFCPVKCISVFIDFKHDEFFSITSLFKTALFLSCYRLSKNMDLLQREAEESHGELFYGGEKNESFFAGSIGHFGQCIEKGGLSSDSL